MVVAALAITESGVILAQLDREPTQTSDSTEGAEDPELIENTGV